MASSQVKAIHEWVRRTAYPNPPQVVDLAAVVPAGSGLGYAIDAADRVIGLTISYPGVGTPSLLELLPDLRRVVIYNRHEAPIDLRALCDARNLEFVYLIGAFSALPSGLFALPLVLDQAPEGRTDEFMVVQTTMVSVEQALGDGDETRSIPSDLRHRVLELRGLVLEECEISDPPLELIRQGPTALREYFAARDQEELPLKQLKLLVVGSGGSGKTSLVKRLLAEPFNPTEDQTHGINIRELDLAQENGDEVTARIWDFGGQDIMHSTHQFFFSKRSVYVVVLDGRKEDDPEYWLQHIRSFGGESPVIVVLNKIDQNPASDVNRRFLREKYPTIKGFLPTSCATGDGIQDLVRMLRKVVADVPMLRTPWPARWFAVKERLASFDTPYVSLREYSDLCVTMGVSRQDAQLTLVGFLHDLGIVLRFPELELLDTHVLDPRWVTGAVYELVTSAILATQHGILTFEQVSEILARKDAKKYPPDKHGFVIKLMEKFELCYRLDATRMLVPDLLDIQEPYLEVAGSGVAIVLRYSYLPKSIMPRFIVRMHRDIPNGAVWRTGAVLVDRDRARAIVRADSNAKEVRIEANGEGARDYLAALRQVFRELHKSYEHLPVEELVPLPGIPGGFVDYQELLGLQAVGRDELYLGRHRAKFSVSSLIDGIERPEHKQPFAMIVATASDVEPEVTGARGPNGYPRGYEPSIWEKAIATGCGAAMLLLIGFIVIRNERFLDQNIVVLVRISLGLGVAILGATVPGLLHVDFSKKGLVIRAAGALALFVLSMILTPAVLPSVPDK